jgi:hypothetical protein
LQNETLSKVQTQSMSKLQDCSHEDTLDKKTNLHMSLFQSKCKYKVAEPHILGSYEFKYSMIEEFNYSFSKFNPNWLLMVLSKTYLTHG